VPIGPTAGMPARTTMPAIPTENSPCATSAVPARSRPDLPSSGASGPVEGDELRAALPLDDDPDALPGAGRELVADAHIG
jgi:hypothetical protein